MESMQQRVMHKLYGSKAALMARIVALENEPNITTYGQEELYRCIGAKEHIDAALELLGKDPEVEDGFQIELPF